MRRSATSGHKRRRQREETETEGQRDGEMKRRGGEGVRREVKHGMPPHSNGVTGATRVHDEAGC